MQPVKEVFFLCCSLRIQRSPCFIFVGITDEAAQIERLRRIRRDRQNRICAFCLCNRLGQIALRQDFSRFFVAPVVQSVLRIFRKGLHRACLQGNCGYARDDHAHEQEARRRDGVFAFLPCQQQQGNRCGGKEQDTRLHKRRCYTQGCQ